MSDLCCQPLEVDAMQVVQTGFQTSRQRLWMNMQQLVSCAVCTTMVKQFEDTCH